MKVLAPNYQTQTVHAIDKDDLPKVTTIDTKGKEVAPDRKSIKVIPMYLDNHYIEQRKRKERNYKKGYMAYSEAMDYIHE